jgi:hypothetical protein
MEVARPSDGSAQSLQVVNHATNEEAGLLNAHHFLLIPTG